MADVDGVVRAVLANLGVADTQGWQDLSREQRRRILKQLAARLSDLLGETEYASVLDTLRGFVDDPEEQVKSYVRELLENWLGEHDLAPSDTLANALIAAFEQPQSVFADCEWVTMPYIWPDAKQAFFAKFNDLRDFIYKWDRGQFIGSSLSDPQARPNIFAAAACVRYDTPLYEVFCRSASSPEDAEEEARDWLVAIAAWGRAQGKPDRWLTIDPKVVAREDPDEYEGVYTIQHIVEPLLWAS